MTTYIRPATPTRPGAIMTTNPSIRLIHKAAAASTLPPMPIAIENLMTELTTAWAEWQKTQTSPATPAQTTLDSTPDVATLTKSASTDARWSAMLARVGPVQSVLIRSRVAQESLALAVKMGIAPNEAIAITKGLCVAAEPARRGVRN